jgi:uncharacterized protein YfaT (DUF1175 family)
MLNSVLSLHDIEDVERFCGYLIDRQSRGAYRGQLAEELLAWFIGECWRLSLRFDPERGSSFANFCASSVRVASWERLHFGRTRWVSKAGVYERKRPTFVPLAERPDEAVYDPDDPDELRGLLGL